MSKDNILCKRCGTPIVLPKNIKDILSKAEISQTIKWDELLHLCPKCRAQTFAERTIGGDLQRVPRNWPLPKRRSEERKSIRYDKRTGRKLIRASAISVTVAVMPWSMRKRVR